MIHVVGVWGLVRSNVLARGHWRDAVGWKEPVPQRGRRVAVWEEERRQIVGPGLHVCSDFAAVEGADGVGEHLVGG